VVVFTGHETKLMMNSSTTPIKSTKVQHMVNSQILFLLLCLLLISVAGAMGQLYAELNSDFNRGILLNPQDRNPWFPDFPLNILTYIILFNNLIPLSLVVTVEFVKLVLSRFVNEDLDMYYSENDTPATAKTSNLIEELGQIDYIFSDKTGTLTRNIMEYKMASIGGFVYADEIPTEKDFYADGDEIFYKTFDELKFEEKRGDGKLISEFLLLLAVCHTVIPEKSANDDKIIYQASSPDEAALVDGARKLGYLFHTRKPRSVIITVDGGEDQEYEILAVNEFNSTRKRMSVVVRDPSGQVKVMIKGADTVIFERLSPGNPHLDLTSGHLNRFACVGLRTLILASRDIPLSEYEQWKKTFDEAAASINNRQDALDAAAELIEKDLELLGATAIEDKLQDGVPDTISTLMEAGIKVWVLTGDRQETAINIGMSCKLIKPEMTQIICNEPTLEGTKQFLSERLALLKAELGAVSFQNSRWEMFWRGTRGKRGKFNKDAASGLHPLALIIDGKSLDNALDPEVSEIFLELAMFCRAVICCRVSPLQKALVVKLVKDNVAGAVTLAIGDGANDVSMIQAAHVGIGISGQEGLQAARSADFAIAQFRFLRNLLLVHGGWAYSRVTKVISIMFYKNLTLYLIQFWFAMNNNYSAMTLFESWSSVSSYNVVWTLLPPIAIGVFDQYVGARVLDRYPEMYRVGQQDHFYNHKIFLGFFLNSVFHSLLLFWIWAYILGDGDILVSGMVADNWVFGTMVYATTLIAVMYKHLLYTSHFVFWITLSIVASLLVFFIFFPVYATFGPRFGLSTELFNVTQSIVFSIPFWLALILVPVIVNLRDFAWK
jgi:phospholipid-transporting ATPase